MALFGFSLLAFFASLVFCRLLIKVAPKDAPDDDRKVQSVAVPTSGGLAIAAAIFLPWMIYLITHPTIWVDSAIEGFGYGAAQIFAENNGNYLVLLGFIALTIGAIDDRFMLPARLKLAILAGAALLVSFLGEYVGGIFLPHVHSYVIIASWIGIGGTALWLFVVMNATNFMDGSNGLAMGTLAIMLLGVSTKLGINVNPVATTEIFAEISSLPFFAVFGTLTTAAILGFLFWNLQGKLYAGDAGSLFGGAVLASLGIYAAQDGNIWFPATLALPFLVDVFMTLIWRARAGHNLLTPHRHHAYQLFIRAGWGHIRTALLWWALAAICAVAGLWAASESKSMSAWVFFGLLGAGCALWLWQRRVYGPRASA